MTESSETAAKPDSEPMGLNCPECGDPPQFVVTGGSQAFCGNDDCRMFMWDPAMTRAEMLAAGVHEVHLRTGREGPA